MTNTIESSRTEALWKAQERADELFRLVEAKELIRPGMTESQLNEKIHKLAETEFGVTRHWHKRIVRAGSNTLAPYDENPPDLPIAEDDIVFLDLGPVFEEWEADFGHTFGSDPVKQKLPDDIGKAFAEGWEYFKLHPDITAAELCGHARELATKYGWEFGGTIAGHLVGRIPGDKITLYVHPQNPNRMRNPGVDGQARHWILEIHFVDRARKIGGFYEQLPTVD